jgi:hypothetical protein
VHTPLDVAKDLFEQPEPSFLVAWIARTESRDATSRAAEETAPQSADGPETRATRSAAARPRAELDCMERTTPAKFEDRYGGRASASRSGIAQHALRRFTEDMASRASLSPTGFGWGCAGSPPPPPKAEPPGEQRRDITVEMSPMSVASTGIAIV